MVGVGVRVDIFNLWPWSSIPGELWMVMTDTHAKGQGERSVGSKNRVETEDGRTDGQRRLHYPPSMLKGLTDKRCWFYPPSLFWSLCLWQKTNVDPYSALQCCIPITRVRRRWTISVLTGLDVQQLRWWDCRDAIPLFRCDKPSTNQPQISVNNSSFLTAINTTRKPS